MMRFECTRCGDCCRRPGIVWLEAGELHRLARHLDRPPSRLRAELPVLFDADAESEYIEVGEHGCPLLGSNQSCSVDPVKPSQCATFPFWPELVDDPKQMQRLCEGVDRPGAPLVSTRLSRRLARGSGRI
ncbi:MAG: YkgJ family cysteine cluster protein [Myxococcota bacterium]